MASSSASASVRTARRTHGFTESVIREMTRVAQVHGALNLAQGFPDFPAPDVLKAAACQAIMADVNQYAITWGTPRYRRALADAYARFYGMEVDEAREITVTCGATEAMAAALLAVVDPGDEVIVFEPFYENYGPDAILCGAKPVWVPLDMTRGGAGEAGLRFELDLDRLAAAFSERTRAIVLNTPNNPTGKVFSRAELEAIAELCRRHDAIAFTDEIYEHILYEGEHLPLATLDGMRERTVTVSGASKTFSVTGWRIGTIVAPPDLTAAIRKVHDFLPVGAPAPLQEACAVALDGLGDEYYRGLARDYAERREVLYEGLVAAGFRCARPAGAYYILADFSDLSDLDDVTFAKRLAAGDLAVEAGAGGGEAARGVGPGTGGGEAAGASGFHGDHARGGVASVPGSSFFHRPGDGARLTRFAFCKQLDTLRAASARLQEITRGA
ncbi:MAG TPA: aminotransferase class I/II-fold pyridoxal phosphate-dependent enzyme [Longimicrobiales bacterium]|nr:aminotransferase class I/II-fold pyridoxal phosphate-dependent enzyme [Longimicrobiales bacterium]